MSRRPSVHPRVCGERIAASWYGRSVDRFIPACAGNAFAEYFIHEALTVHPRVCGERELGVRTTTDADGSSPRVRGTRLLVRLISGRFRFIPACAGNAISRTDSVIFPAVHPRVCGERTHIDALTLAETGSSPRVRGTQRLQLDQAQVNRFIPACAGNASPCVPDIP